MASASQYFRLYKFRFCVFLLFLLLIPPYLWVTSHILLTKPADIFETHEIFNLRHEQFKLEEYCSNVENRSFGITNQMLRIFMKRGSNNFLASIYELGISIDIPLREDLKLTFSIFSSLLDLSTDAGRIYLAVTNGTLVIMLNYVIGYTEKDWNQAQYYYVFYQIGNNTNTWFECERNIWNDLVNKNLPVNSSWRIHRIAFGMISYRRNPTVTDHAVSVFFEADKTSLFYEDLTFIKVTPGDVGLSWPEVYGTILISLLLCICSVILLKTNNNFVRALRIT